MNISIETFEHLIRHSDEVFIGINSEKKIVSVNPAAEKLMRKSAREIIGTSPILKNTDDIGEERIWETLREGRIWAGHILLSENPTDPITLSALIVPIRDNKRAINGYIEIGRDITLQAKDGFGIRKDDKPALRDVLPRGTIHDLNNTLLTISGHAELAMMGLNAEDPIYGNLSEITKACVKAAELVNHSLLSSRSQIAKVPAPQPTRYGEGKRIMYVDDDESLVDLVKRALDRAGHSVTVYSDPKRALEAYRASSNSFDVVVTDRAMPAMSGFALATELLAIRKDLPILMTSGYVDPQDQQLARQIGIVRFVLKRDTVKDLVGDLDAIIRTDLSKQR
jgi:CheY-like chemotaxis protein